jgi:hypothetical protein
VSLNNGELRTLYGEAIFHSSQESVQLLVEADDDFGFEFVALTSIVSMKNTILGCDTV